MVFRYLMLFLLIIVFLPSCRSKSALEALKKGHLEELKYFHKSGDKLSILINKNDTFLTYSIKNRLDDISLWLIENNINNIKTADSFGNTPLILSAIHKSKKVLKVLVKKDLDLNEFNLQGKNLISVIAEQGNYNYFIQLIDKYKVDIKFKVPYGVYEDYTIVEFAIAGGNLDIIKYLKENGFKFKLRKSLNLNLMMIAAEKGYVDVMMYLNSIGFKMDSKNKDGWTTLMSAAKSGKLDAVMLILGYGAKVNAVSKFKWTALMSAAMSGNLDVVSVLVDAGANILLENNDKKNSIEISIDEENYKISDYLRKKVNDK